MPKIFIQNLNAARVAQDYVTGFNPAVHGTDARAITASQNVSGTNHQRQAALVKAHDEAKTPAEKQAALDAIAFYAFKEDVSAAQSRGEYEIERPASYAEFARQSLATARMYAAQEARKELEAKKAEESKAEQTRLANRTPQERALDAMFGAASGRGKVDPKSSRGQILAILEEHYNKLPTDIPSDERYNRARNSIANKLERVDTSFWTSSSEEMALKGALRTLDAQQTIEKQAASRKATEQKVPAQPTATEKADPERVPVFGSPENYYGQLVSIASNQARNTARIAILGAGDYFNRARVKEILNSIEVKPSYTKAELRNLYDQAASATDEVEKNAILAALSVLTLENRFAELRAQGKQWKMFADAEKSAAFIDQSTKSAGSYSPDDQTVAPVTGAGDGASVGGDTTTRTGFRKVYGRKDGSMPVPPEDEVPTFTDAEQVKELQRSLGLTGAEVDGMYGPVTHAAMKAKAAEQSKQPKDYNFTLQDIWDGFIALLTGAVTGTGQTAQPAAGIDASVLATAKTLMEGKTEDALDFRTKAANGKLDGISDDTILSNLPDKLAPYQLTAEEMSSIRVAGGILSSDLLKSAERLLGLNEDGKLDAKLQAALDDDTVRAAVLAAVRSGAGAAPSADVGAPAGTPGPGGGTAQGR